MLQMESLKKHCLYVELFGATKNEPKRVSILDKTQP